MNLIIIVYAQTKEDTHFEVKIDDQHSGSMVVSNQYAKEVMERLKPSKIYYHCQSKFED